MDAWEANYQMNDQSGTSTFRFEAEWQVQKYLII